VHYPLSRKTDPGNPWPEGLAGMRRKQHTSLSTRVDILHHAKLVSGAPRVFSAPSQINMTNRRKTVPGPFTTSQISMANPVSECIILPWSNQHDQSGRMSARCYSSVDVYWSFTTPFCIMSQNEVLQETFEAFTTSNTGCYILCLCCTECH
jgi:hypothetical protein